MPEFLSQAPATWLPMLPCAGHCTCSFLICRFSRNCFKWVSRVQSSMNAINYKLIFSRKGQVEDIRALVSCAYQVVVSEDSSDTMGKLCGNAALSNYADELVETAKKIIAPGKGILAADESTGTIGKRVRAPCSSLWFLPGCMKQLTPESGPELKEEREVCLNRKEQVLHACLHKLWICCKCSVFCE